MLLLNTGLRTLLAILFGAYLDKRELQNALSGDVFEQPGRDGELWLDYVADLGDGFHATYSVAYLLAQPRLAVGGRVLPRGDVLLMGGDQVYPVANGDEYENRTKGPYRAALPEAPADGSTFDRGPSSGPNPWSLTAADGAVASTDFNSVIQQFGHNCN